MGSLKRPLLLEGDAGVGKTTVVNALEKVKETKPIRLQCYEGLVVHAAVYEWNTQRQFLEIRRHKGKRDQMLEEEDFF